jgi:hypothetical protein
MQVKKEAPTAIGAPDLLTQTRFYPNQGILASLKSELGSLLLIAAGPLPADLRAYRLEQFEKTLNRFTQLKYKEL